jgi:integrase
MAKRTILTDKRAKALGPGDKRVSDGTVPCLYLEPTEAKRRSRWLFRFVSPVHRRRRDFVFGSYPEMSIADARIHALEFRKLGKEGFDPIDLKQSQAKVGITDSVMTFKKAALTYIETKKSGWKNKKHAEQWPSTLQAYAFPKIGDKSVNSLTVDDFFDVLNPIWLDKIETANRVKQRCETIMDWCIAKRIISSHPAKSVGFLLPDRKRGTGVTHFPAMPYRHLPDFFANVLHDGTKGTCRELLEMLILTVARSGEARQMRWEQIDEQQKVWVIPADVTKMGRIHDVPLSDRCMEILNAQRERHMLLTGSKPLPTDLVFPAPRGKMFSDMTLSKFLKDRRISSDTTGRFAVPHGFRTSFRSWATSNELNENAIEGCLAHVEKSKAVAAYKRESLLEKRKDILSKYSDFCLSR